MGNQIEQVTTLDNLDDMADKIMDNDQQIVGLAIVVVRNGNQNSSVVLRTNGENEKNTLLNIGYAIGAATKKIICNGGASK